MSRYPFRRVLELGLPILVTQLGMIATGFADTIMVGRYSTDALASASFVNTVFNTAICACLGMTFGVMPLVGALFTQKREADSGRLVKRCMLVDTLFSLIVCGCMAILYANLHHLGQPEELLPVIRPYYLIYLAGVPAIACYNVFAQWSYAINNTRMPMWIILAANAANVILNALLIYGLGPFPEMGLFGAGIATFIARYGALVAIVIVFFFSKAYRGYALGWHGRGPLSEDNRAAAYRKIVATSLPLAGQMAFEAGSFSIAGVMVGWIGTIALAAYQIVMVTGTLGFCVYISMGNAVAVMVSNAAGTSDYCGMRRAAWAGYAVIMALAVVASLIFAGGSHLIVGWFTTDTAVFATALTLIFPLILYQGADATQICFGSALRGTSYVMPMLWIAFVSYIVVQTPVAYLAAFTLGMGVRGIVLSFFVSLLMAATLYLVYFLRHTRGNYCETQGKELSLRKS